MVSELKRRVSADVYITFTDHFALKTHFAKHYSVCTQTESFPGVPSSRQ